MLCSVYTAFYIGYVKKGSGKDSEGVKAAKRQETISRFQPLHLIEAKIFSVYCFSNTTVSSAC